MHTTNGATPAPGVPDAKTLTTVAAAFALKGHALRTTTRADDGRVTFTVSRWNQSRAFTHWNDVLAFLAQVEGQPAVPAACHGCPDNFPLPAAMDFFDRIVIADYIQRRTACDLCPPDCKPCLKRSAA